MSMRTLSKRTSRGRAGIAADPLVAENLLHPTKAIKRIATSKAHARGLYDKPGWPVLSAEERIVADDRRARRERPRV
jgi:hypothetical protein